MNQTPFIKRQNGANDIGGSGIELSLSSGCDQTDLCRTEYIYFLQTDDPKACYVRPTHTQLSRLLQFNEAYPPYLTIIPGDVWRSLRLRPVRDAYFYYNKA